MQIGCLLQKYVRQVLGGQVKQRHRMQISVCATDAKPQGTAAAARKTLHKQNLLLIMELTLQQWEIAMRTSGISVNTKEMEWLRPAMRIENTMLSVAKYAGGAKINGILFLYVNPVDERTFERVDLIVCERLLDWAQKNMGMHHVSKDPKPVPLTKQMELFK